ncbi:glycosyltransferase [Methylomicrobium sp. RS1]|jgi:sterol 3beta-glucosyltransferase|uniref:glycosyltransferase n=1 Tax=Candidatus Methylomicrobium oryzae TaxID=2802053 RepID=UPI001923EBAF|nr:glycosyltransferase [Methylomicrobium sp. RS1]MBL1265436.1 glycosyltransferase family 1 protein [Methylomicrobium sp. RS1]
MKIGIQTWGSNGDVRPMLALADGLRKAGHQVTLAVSSIDNQSYRSICEQMRIGYRQIPERFAFDMEDFAERSFRMNPLQWLKALLDEAFFPVEPLIYQAAQSLVAENDCVIGHHFLYPLKLAATLQDKPFFSVTLCHAAVPASALPPFGFPDLGKHLNPISWKLLDAIFNWALKQPLTRLWREAGLMPPAHMLSELLTSQQLNLVAVDPVFCQGREDWPAFHQACGFLNLTEDTRRWQWPESLLAFLETGPAPAYMTFGSLQQAVPEWSMELFLQAAEKSGCRAIVQSSSPRYPAGSQQGNVYFIGKHPHQPVFGRCAAVVHHGGAGTTQAATRAGCPSVAVPFMEEQLFWATQLQRMGLAGKPLPAKRVNADALAQAVANIISDPGYGSRAQRIGEQMRAHDGVAEAVELLTVKFRSVI